MPMATNEGLQYEGGGFYVIGKQGFCKKGIVF